MSLVVAAPAACLGPLDAYPWSPRFAELADEVGRLRMHYVDEGPSGADPVLLLHGQPTWSYLYRKLIPLLVERGHRVIAPDYIGYGRSDRIEDRLAYTLERHIGWLSAFVRHLDLTRATVFVQDWGGPIGLGMLVEEGNRFDRVVAADTVLHTCEPWLADKLVWANYATGDGRMVIQEALLEWMLATVRNRDLSPGAIVASIAVGGLSEDERRAYDAPFPDEHHRAGLRQMNALIPVSGNDPGAIIDRRSFGSLTKWERPFLTIWGADDPGTAGWDRVFQERVPGAAGQPHRILAGAGHFIQEDQPGDLAAIIDRFIIDTKV